MKTLPWILVALGAAAVLNAGAGAQTLNLVAGAATAQFNPMTATGGGLADFRPEGGITTDHVFQNWWWYRVNGLNTRENPFPTGTIAGNNTASGSYSWTGLEGGRFDAVLSLTLAHGPITGAAMISQSLTITNTGTGSLDIALFHYLDFDLAGTAAGDSAVWQNQSANLMRITDGSTFANYQGPGANAYQVTAFATLRGLLTDTSVSNFNNTGLPFGPGDFTGGFQWNSQIAIAPLASITYQTIQTVNMEIPGPSGLELLMLVGMISGRRRRA